MKIGDALLKLGVDKSEFDRAMKETQKNIESSLQGMQTSLRMVGVAFTAVGIAGLKFTADARKLNAQLAQTGITIGASTKEMRNLALAITDVSFPLESVTATFELLARAGIRNTEELKASAQAFDALGDATGSSAETVADLLIPAFKNLGVALPQSSAELDKFTWLVKNTTVDLTDFGQAMLYVAAYGKNLDLTIEDMIAIMAALEAKGITGAAVTRVFRSAISQAASSGRDLNSVLGLTQAEVDSYKDKLKDATGITDEYADAANTQYGILDKLKQAWSEMTLRLGSALQPLESVFVALTALGPVMIFLTTAIGRKTIAITLATAAWIKNTLAMVAARIAAIALGIALSALLIPLGAIVGAIAVLGLGLYYVWKYRFEIAKSIPILGRKIDAEDAYTEALRRNALANLDRMGIQHDANTTLEEASRLAWEHVQVLNAQKVAEEGVTKAIRGANIAVLEQDVSSLRAAKAKDRLAQAAKEMGLTEKEAQGMIDAANESITNQGIVAYVAAHEKEGLKKIAEDLGVSERKLKKILAEANIELAKQGATSGTAAWQVGASQYLMPKFQGGGIVTKPTIALLGERGPEIILPLKESLKNIGLQLGGIVTRPSIRMLGEAGPEAVIPLSEGGIRGATVNNYIEIKSQAFMGTEAEARQWARIIGNYLRQEQRRKGPVTI